MPLNKSIAVGDKVVYTGSNGPGLPDNGEIGVVSGFKFNDNAPTDFIVGFPDGQVTLPFNVWDLYVEKKPTSVGKIVGIGLGVTAVVIGVAGWWWYKHKDSVVKPTEKP